MLLTRRDCLALGLAGAAGVMLPAAPTFAAVRPTELTRPVMRQQVNAIRRVSGFDSIDYSIPLEKAAQYQADVMAEKDTMTHEVAGPFGERMARSGYRGAAGENIAAGQQTLEDVLEDWLFSPGHRKNMLSPEFTEFGLAVARAGSSSRYVWYWAMILGRPG